MRVKLYFQHHYSSLQCHMIFRDRIKTLMKHVLISMLKTVVLRHICVETVKRYCSKVWGKSEFYKQKLIFFYDATKYFNFKMLIYNKTLMYDIF